MKKIYRKISKKIRNLTVVFYKFKVNIAEWIAILRKDKLYRDIKLNRDDVDKINNLWVQAYGKKISKRWHKLYTSINGRLSYDYFPDHIFSTKLEPKLNPIEVAKFYSDKGLTELLYKSVNEAKFPETVIVNCSGYYQDKLRNIINKSEAIRLLLSLEEFIIKPTIGGSSGQSVKLVSLIDKDADEKERLIKSILDIYDQNYIVQLRLIPHKSLKKLYPHSINTIRIITYIVENEIYHAPLSLRMGVHGNKVDNIHAGGIVIGLSDDGYLKRYGYQLGYCDSKIKFEKHPDTEIAFEGYYIPQIDRIIDIAKKLHLNTPHLGIISWDFMLDNLGEVVLVEGNYFGQSIWFPQIVHGKPIFGENTEIMLSLLNKD